MSKGISIHKLYAPRCAIVGCREKVDYHSKKQKKDNSWSYHWKTCCERHRNDIMGKAEAKEFKKSRGCEAHKAGWECPGHHEDSLTIDHFDGNKHNNSPENIVVLCANCHQKKTAIYKNSTQRYTNNAHLSSSLWEIKE